MADLPDTVDLRPYLWGVEDVANLPAAAASSAATALEYHCNRINEPATNLSTMFIHYNARLAAGEEGQNTGTTLEGAMKAVLKYGACPDALWPVDESKVTVKPSQAAYDAAKKYANVQYYSPADVMQALSMHYPVPFIASLPKRCIDEAGRTGVMPAPTADEMRGKLNHHSMVLVGYDKPAGVFTARNCWGKSWGSNGHCTIPMEVFKVIAPANTSRIWIFAKPDAAPKDMEPAAAPISAPAAAPAAAPSEKISDMVAKMKDEIRDSLKKDLEESQKRIRDMMKKPGQP